MEIVRLPYKLSYAIGEAFVLSGMTVNVYHVGDSGKTLIHSMDEAAMHPDRYEIQGFDSSVGGRQNVELVYKSFNEAVGQWVYARAGFTVDVQTTATTTTTTSTTTTTAETTTTTVTTTMNEQVPAGTNVKLGDINFDGKVDSVDASGILAEYARLSSNRPSEFDEKQAIAADVDESGRIDSVDASKVLAFYAYLSGGGEITDIREWLK